MRAEPVLGWVSVGLSLVLIGLVVALALRSTPGTSPAPTGGSAIVPYAIVVDGTAEASAPPDVAYLSLGVDSPARTAAEATATNASAMAAVIAAVKAQGIPDKDVRTQDFSVSPVYAPPRPIAAAASAAPTPIESGQLTVSAHVQVAFSYAH